MPALLEKSQCARKNVKPAASRQPLVAGRPLLRSDEKAIRAGPHESSEPARPLKCPENLIYFRFRRSTERLKLAVRGTSAYYPNRPFTDVKSLQPA